MIIQLEDVDNRNVTMTPSLTTALPVCLALIYICLASRQKDGKHFLFKNYRAIQLQIQPCQLLFTLHQF